MKVKLQKVSIKKLLPLVSVTALVIGVGLAFTGLALRPKLTHVLMATRDLAQGETLSARDVQQIDLPLGVLPLIYQPKVEPGAQLAHSISKGQLISRVDLVRIKSQLVPIRLNNLKPISKAITIGDVVDIWAVDISPSSTSSAEPIAFSAIVTAIENTNSMAQVSTNVEVRLDRSYLESVLRATDSHYELSLILHETLADEL